MAERWLPCWADERRQEVPERSFLEWVGWERACLVWEGWAREFLGWAELEKTRRLEGRGTSETLSERTASHRFPVPTAFPFWGLR